MHDPFASHVEDVKVHPAQKIQGTVAGLFQAEGTDFVTTAVKQLNLTFEGIPGDFHAGHTRRSGGREPWYKRGTEMRNERQLTLLSPAELETIARRLDIPELKPEWIGGNLLLEGISDLTKLPPRTVLFFEGGVTIRIDGDNHPCRLSGQSIAAHFESRGDIELDFVRHGMGLRGLVGWVEVPGSIVVGEAFEARIPPQWIYQA